MLKLTVTSKQEPISPIEANIVKVITDMMNNYSDSENVEWDTIKHSLSNIKKSTHVNSSLSIKFLEFSENFKRHITVQSCRADGYADILLISEL